MQDKYDYTAKLGCKFHEMNDASLHCCLSIVKRWAFTFVDYCLIDELHVEKIPGKHHPVNCDVGTKTELKLSKNPLDKPLVRKKAN